MQTMKDGLLLINKPAGMTSHDVVYQVRKLINERKIGHAGTLDPMATGLLLLAVGKATKKISRLVGLNKSYSATITLGSTSDTDDAEGNISPINNHVPGDKDIRDACKRFIGEIEQVPPVFSAIKINGVRAYKKARRGETVELKPRKVNIYSIDILSYRYPELYIVTNVSSGTYIRALARDIGESLGTGAFLSKLTRERIGDYQLKDATRLEDLKENTVQLLPL